jgi:hypothetical protein
MRRGVAGLLLLMGITVSGDAGERSPGVHPLAKKWSGLGEMELTFADGKQTVIASVDFRIMGDKPAAEVRAALAEIAALPDVRTIMLVGLAFTDEAVAELGKCKKLTTLNLYGTKATDKAFVDLSKVSTLNRLSFTGAGLSDKAMKEIAKLPELVFLEVTDAPITDNGLMDLRRAMNLRRLLLTNTRTTDRGVANLQALIPHLRTTDAMMLR